MPSFYHVMGQKHIRSTRKKKSSRKKQRTYGIRSSRGPKTGSYKPPGIGRFMKSSKLALVSFKTLCFRTSSVVMKLNHTASTESVAPCKIHSIKRRTSNFSKLRNIRFKKKVKQKKLRKLY